MREGDWHVHPLQWCEDCRLDGKDLPFSGLVVALGIRAIVAAEDDVDCAFNVRETGVTLLVLVVIFGVITLLLLVELRSSQSVT